tara:strand:+ start:1175 stop:1378 length:204 start_codon:yes stop_codon:yes gene_type:complete
MTTQLDHNTETMVFQTLVDVELSDTDRGRRGHWKSETRLEMLAHELVRYDPALASLLVEAGRQKLGA